MVAKMTEIDRRCIAFENDHAYLKSTSYYQKDVESLKTKTYLNEPKNHAAALLKTPFVTKHQNVIDINKIVSKSSSLLNVSSTSNIYFLTNSSNCSLPTNISLSPNKLAIPKLTSLKKSSLIPILPKITSTKEIFPTQSNILFVPSTNVPLKINSQNKVQKKPPIKHKLPQTDNLQEHIVEIIKPINNNLDKNVDNRVSTIKLSSDLLKRIQSGEKLFMCMECDKIYTNHKDLLDHQMIHDKIDKNLVGHKKDKKETVFINKKPSIKAVENEKIVDDNKNVIRISKSSDNLPANHKKQKVVFQGECIMCHSIFQDLDKHLKTVHNSDLYKNKISHQVYHCHKCNEEFDIKSQLLAHDSSAHRDINAHTCKHCFENFSFSEDLEAHLETHCTGSKKYLCPYCDAGFPHSNGLRSHLIKHIGFNVLENTAHKSTASLVEYSPTRSSEQLDQIFAELNHAPENNNEIYVERVANNDYRVRFVKDESISIDDPSSPLQSVTDKHFTIDAEVEVGKNVNSKSIICDQEQKSLNKNRVSYTVCRICMVIVSYSRIGKHMKKKHNDAAPYQCEICHAEFNRKHIMDDHRRKHTNNKPHKCNECSKCFTYKHHLNRHMVLLHKSDSVEKLFKCSACDKAFSFKEYLTLHINSRHKGKHYMCQVCGKSFSTNATLTKHQLCHTDERPFMCEHCGRTFKCKTHCETHTKNMHPADKKFALPEKFECDVCNKNFTTKIYRDMHYKRHNGQGHKCGICYKLFVSKAHLQRHIKIMHRN